MILSRPKNDPPADRETRVLRRFAWLPVRCDDGTTRWLERVMVRQVYAAPPGCRPRWVTVARGPVAASAPSERARRIVFFRADADARVPKKGAALVHADAEVGKVLDVEVLPDGRWQVTALVLTTLGESALAALAEQMRGPGEPAP